MQTLAAEELGEFSVGENCLGICLLCGGITIKKPFAKLQLVSSPEA